MNKALKKLDKAELKD
ncbi:hypothetical protein KSF78_0005531 [Schistosoma japonicum]|nr:hypothetical protein KSF78_0005531 [Schistosoma japonicum]